MTKLKTLKDMGTERLRLLSKVEIKEEAIKWIKENRRLNIDLTEHYWKDFFNITEDDLK